MHHSRVSTLMIDCLDQRFGASAAFWGAALGFAPPRPRPGQRYLTLGAVAGPLFIRLQRVVADPGFHLDIECDSVPRESARLERLGAGRKYKIKRWWVMEDPSGNPFCVIRPGMRVNEKAEDQINPSTRC